MATESLGDWDERGKCRESDPDAMFVSGRAQNVAALVCRSCEVMPECLIGSLDRREEFGVWGGLTERKRKKILKNPHATKRVIAMAQHEIAARKRTA